MDNASEFLKRSLQVYSPTYNEQPAAEFFVAEMSERNFKKSYSDNAGNAIGIWGSGPIQILFLGHIDTVPGKIDVYIDDKQQLWGRGSCDAKGGMCAIISALTELPGELKELVTVTVAGCVEEECATSKGAHQILEDFEEPHYVINGEPSGWNVVTIGYKGGVRFALTHSQPMTHFASKDAAVNEIAFSTIRSIHEYIENLDFNRESAFASPRLEIRNWNSSNDGLQEDVKVFCNLRIPPNFDNAAFEEFVKNIDTPMNIEYSESLAGYESDSRSKLVRAFTKAIRQQDEKPVLKKKTGSSDLGVVSTRWKQAEMVAYSPGDSTLDHTPEERIDLNEYRKSIAILKAVVEDLSNNA